VSVLVAKLLRVPIVNSRHNELQQRTGLAAIASSLDPVCIRACDGVVCHGPFTADQTRQIGVPESKIFVYEDSLATFVIPLEELDAPERLSDFAKKRDHIVTFIGRVQRDKGVFDLLEAVSRLRASELQVGLIYAGDGQDMVHLRQQARDSAAADDVLFMGKVEHSQLPGVIRLSTLVVTPTRPEFPEGRCKVVLESLVLGVPVIAPSFGPFPYAIDHDTNGLLFEPGSKQSLWECLSRAVEGSTLLQRLRQGALNTSTELLKEKPSFGQAVNAAFLSSS